MRAASSPAGVPPALLFLLFLSLPLLTANASDPPVYCDTWSQDGETHLEVRIDQPPPGFEARAFWPECQNTVVAGMASTLGISPPLDIVIAIDTSSSTGGDSGVDIDGDGDTDTVLEAEVAAVRDFVHALDPGGTRVAIVDFACPIAGGVHTRVQLTWDFQEVLWALHDIQLDGAEGATDYEAAMDLMSDEYVERGGAGRVWYGLFLSDGEPTVPAMPKVAALQATWRATLVGYTMDTFGVGEDIDPDLLTEMAEILNGEFHHILEPAQILDVLPGHSLVGIDGLTVDNLHTGQRAHATLSPDGGYWVSVPVQEGHNDFIVRAVADDADATTVDCRTDAEMTCIVLTCPESRVEECENGGAVVEGFAAEVDETGVALANDSPFDGTAPSGDGDASGLYPRGATEVTFTASDPQAGVRSCLSTVTVQDTLPPEITCPDPVVVGTGPDDTDCLVPVDLQPIVHDLCETAPPVRSDAPALYPLGTTEVTFTATDAAGHSASCATSVRVVDDTPPWLTCPEDVAKGTGPDDTDCQVPVPLEATLADNCDDSPSLASDELPLYPLGTTTVTFTGADFSGNTSSCATEVTIFDDTPPRIALLQGREFCLWPPDHRFHCMASDQIFDIWDNCTPEPARGVACLPDPPGNASWNEPGDATGDGAFAVDCVTALDGASGMCVRAERQGNGPDLEGRVYSIGLSLQDEAGNTCRDGVTISVAHDRGGGARCASLPPGKGYGPEDGTLPSGYPQFPLPGSPGQTGKR